MSEIFAANGFIPELDLSIADYSIEGTVEGPAEMLLPGDAWVVKGDSVRGSSPSAAQDDASNARSTALRTSACLALDNAFLTPANTVVLSPEAAQYQEQGKSTARHLPALSAEVDDTGKHLHDAFWQPSGSIGNSRRDWSVSHAF